MNIDLVQSQDNNDVLAYWLSNTSTLLFLLQRTLKASGAAGGAPQRRRSNSVTLFGRMTQVSDYILCGRPTQIHFCIEECVLQLRLNSGDYSTYTLLSVSRDSDQYLGYQGFRQSPQPGAVTFGNGGIMGGLEMARQVEAKYPALLFKQQLTAYVEKIYGMVRDNLKKEISPLLGLCIQV